ncbi:B12-binding domain-containing radical SAM protein [Actinomadura rupiterrae]|uniref:B12-binding domain-containing radical SAM protein n=1 Tax=Actinomadura rupiterrae TaxID=559627 RepID=UPI0020A3CEAF|nr:radical SAM protein [Actinomadura rupiterrae]MCP2339299.1 putative methyltransferase [Actinomadura rupiterrae]
MSARTRVAMVEVPLYPNTLPLVSGYLQAYATRDAAIARSHDFVIHSRPVGHPAEKLVAELVALDADVYAMSCYLWNMRRFQTVLDELLKARPEARFILGGPQVMDHIADYVAPGQENVTVANGEGETTFAAYLEQLARPEPDLRQVPGVSFWQDGTLVTTDKPDRLRDLDEIPSPFAAGIFDGADYTFAVVETNRGCPFRCTYCYWGAATNDKIHRWGLDRVKRDLTWISEHGVESVFLADANWGALPRDVELTRHLVACRERTGYPLMVNMQAAKNRPDRVTEITEILVDGGMLTSQPVSLQTVSPQALRMVDRANIKESTYVELQRKLHDKQISSYTELIWPLPGETLDSFRAGIGRLCRSEAGTVVVYPQLLLRNTPMERQREQLGIDTVRVADDASEADLVVGTKWVDREEYEEGVWFYYAVITLYNARALYHTAGYLDASGACDHTAFLTAAVRWFQEHTENPLCRFFAHSIAEMDQYDLNNVGKALHLAMHHHRAELDTLLMDFLRNSPWWRDPVVRALAEIDLLARPYIYREPVALPPVPLHETSAEQLDRYRVEVRMPLSVLPHLRVSDLPVPETGETALLRLDHRGRRKMPYPRHRSIEHNAAYCQAMMNRLHDIMPTWTAPTPVEARDAR